DGVQRNKGTLHVGKLVVQAFLGRVYHHLGAFAEQELLHLDKAIEVALVDLAGIDLVDLSLVQEDDFVDLSGLVHGAICQQWSGRIRHAARVASCAARKHSTGVEKRSSDMPLSRVTGLCRKTGRF